MAAISTMYIANVYLKSENKRQTGGGKTDVASVVYVVDRKPGKLQSVLTLELLNYCQYINRSLSCYNLFNNPFHRLH